VSGHVSYDHRAAVIRGITFCLCSKNSAAIDRSALQASVMAAVCANVLDMSID
jgi:hypothetical protein